MSKAIVLRRGAFRSLCGVLAIAALAACGSFPPAPAQVASPDYNYLIGPLDTLNIIVWRTTLQRLDLKLEDGMDVVITGKVSS